MAYREKIAWLTLGTMLVAYTIYFSLLTDLAGAGEPPMADMLTLFAAVTVTQAAIVVGATVAIAVRQRRDAQAKPDERDRSIARRGAAAAYYTLMVGMIVVGVVMPFSEPSWKIINTALLALVLSEAVRYVLIILSYRRGWHG